MKHTQGKHGHILDRQNLLTHPREDEIDLIFQSVWETAVYKNPMCLVKMVDPNSVFRQMRAMIRDYRGRGISEVHTREAVLEELLQSAASGRLPRGGCDDETAH